MRKLALIVLAAASLIGTANVASAQYWSGGHYYDGPRRHHHHHYPRYYHDYNYDRGYRGGYYREQPRYRTPNGCRPGYTVQDGVCKPYTGR